MGEIAARLDELPPILRYEPEPLPTPELPESGRFEVTQPQEGVFEVDAPWMAQVLGSVNMNDYESLQYFQRVLRQSGIIDALEDAGVREGDTVTLCGYSFDYMP